jgi:N-acetylmuramoyl-L-alanine amidase
MPSVLIETGFLTNPKEENFIGSNDGQTTMANAMFAAFENYKRDLEGVALSPSPDKQTSSIIIEQVDDKIIKPIENDIPNLEEKNDGVIFSIQIETAEAPISLTHSKFKGLPVSEYKQDGFYKYTAGNFANDFKSANKYKNKLRELGFNHAFVVAFKNGTRINLEKAIKLSNK